MYTHKMGTATLAGHGYGAKVALAAGCYNAEKTSGVFCIDSSPMDHRHFEAFREFKTYIKRLTTVEMSSKAYI
jgi:pimeloyl-ACP methyl ester carboxylesterase